MSHTRVALAKDKCCGKFEQRKVDQEFISDNYHKFNMVTVFHVLEHLSEPKAFIANCMLLLKPGGVLLIEVPNLADELLSHSKEYREFYWQRAHISYFDPARLELLIRKTGYNDYNIKGVQRYGLRNLLHWLDQGKPQKSNPDHASQNELLSNYETIIKRKREESLTSDTIIVEIRNCLF